uniref:Ovule protein n=1 Tax=Heterorhabditis bacteriophora TaxID=37862 RepID=A0A1I7WJR7_HETBA
MAFDNSKIEVKEYLPSVWNDDSVMQGYMSMIKVGSIIFLFLSIRIHLFIYLHSYLFRDIHLNILFRKGELISLNEWQEKHSNWVGWGVSRLTKTSASVLSFVDLLS